MRERTKSNMSSKKENRKQLNNQGFTLLELLVAIVVLCIVSIPLLHAFVTTAKTNGKAKIMMHATDAAENLIENFEYQSLADLQVRYQASDQNTVTVDDTGKYTFEIRNTADIPTKLPDGYYMTVTADPNLYPNANSLNLADIKTMSSSESAVYTMPAQYDTGVYEMFEQWNREAYEGDPTSYVDMDTAYFRQNLNRRIEVTIDKVKTDKNDAGEDVDIVRVNLKITYELKNYKGIVPVSRKKYVSTELEMFNNLASKQALSNIYILYKPRYYASIYGKGDNITVNNVQNVKANLFVIAQNGAADEELRTQYLSASNGLRLKVVETPVSAGFPADTKGALTLFTNLNDGTPYSSVSTEKGKVLCFLTYRNSAGSLQTTADYAASILNARGIDGKVLDPDQTKIRIYKTITTVYDTENNIVVELDGTKLE